MTTLTQFTPSNIRSVRARVIEALKEVEKELGITITDGSARYSETTLSLKLEMGLGVGPENTASAQMFKQLATRYGLQPEDFGRRFMSQTGELYEITGLKPTRPKYPISATEVATGRAFKFTADVVRNGIIRR
jgi:hypothetical protein